MGPAYPLQQDARVENMSITRLVQVTVLRDDLAAITNSWIYHLWGNGYGIGIQ